MSNLILSSEDMYRAFLRGIRKSNTSVILPAYWNPFINEVQLQWVKSKLPMVEFSQKRIDDLSPLRIVTDGSALWGATTVISSTTAGIFPIPTLWGKDTAGMPLTSGDKPLYLHGLNVMVRKDTGEWKPALILKSDKTVMAAGNPYRVPATTRIYFERIKDEIRVIGGALENKMRLEYLRYPKIINYSATVNLNTNPELAPSQNQEIKDIAVRTYLEIIMDPRYKSFLQEEMIKSQNN